MAPNTSTRKVEEDRPLLSDKPREKKRREPSRSRLVFLMVMVVVMQMISSMGQGLSVLYVEIIRVFDTSRASAALVQSTFVGISYCAGLLWTSVINKLGPGMSIVLGSLIATAGLIASAFATNVYMLIVLTGLVGGFGMSVAFLGSFMTAGWAFPKHRTAAVALSTTGTSLGMFVFPTLTNYLFEEYGLSGTFMMLAGVSLNVVELGLIVHFAQPYFDTGQQQGSRKTASFDIKLFKHVKFLLLLFVGILIGLFGTIENWFLVDLLVLRGYSRDTGSLFTSLSGLTNMFGRLYGTGMGLCKSAHLLVHATYAFALVGLVHLLVLYLMDYAGLLVSALLFGFSYGITVATIPGVYLEVLGIKHFPQAYGSRNFCHGLGIFFGGLLGGFINDVTGSYNLLFLISTGAMAFTSLSLFSLFIKMKLENRRVKKFSNGALYASLISDNTTRRTNYGRTRTRRSSYEIMYERFLQSCAF